MFLGIYHRDTRRVFRGRRGLASPFGHAFGGSAKYAGLLPGKGKPPVNLMFRFDTSDLAVNATISGARWLPLLCAIQYDACGLGYRVVSDGEVKILRMERRKPDRGYRNVCPDALPPQPVTLLEAPYDPDDVADVVFHAGVFGYDGLTPKQYAKVVRRAQRDAPSHGWDGSIEEFMQNACGPYVQGRPVEGCPDRSCGNHGRPSSLRTVAIYVEHPFDWRKPTDPPAWCPDGDLMIIWQTCPKCTAIQATNQCT